MRITLRPNVAWALRSRLAAAGLIAAALLFVVSPPPAEAQATGSVDIDITFNAITILYYYDDIHINIPNLALSELVTGTASATDFGVNDNTFTDPTNATYSAVDNLIVNDGVPTSAVAWTPGAITLTISNAWTVRALAAVGTDTDVTVGGTFSETLTHTAGAASGEIDVTAGACSGSCTALTPGMFAGASGGVALTLDFTAGNGLVYAGQYDGDGTVFTSTATTS